MGSQFSNYCCDCVGNEERDKKLKELDKQVRELEEQRLTVEAETTKNLSRQTTLQTVEKELQNKELRLQNDKRQIHNSALKHQQSVHTLQDQLQSELDDITTRLNLIEQLEIEYNAKMGQAIKAEVIAKMEIAKEKKEKEKDKDKLVELTFTTENRQKSPKWDRRGGNSNSRNNNRNNGSRPGSRRSSIQESANNFINKFVRSSSASRNRKNRNKVGALKMRLENEPMHITRNKGASMSDSGIEPESYASSASPTSDASLFDLHYYSRNSPNITPLTISPTNAKTVVSLSTSTPPHFSLMNSQTPPYTSYNNNGNMTHITPKHITTPSPLSLLPDIKEFPRNIITILDENSFVDQDVEALSKMLYQTKARSMHDTQVLKEKMVDLLTERNVQYRGKLCRNFEQKYGESLLCAITASITNNNNNKNIKYKSIASWNLFYLEIMELMLLSSAEIDANTLWECIQNWDLKSCAHVICCRNHRQLWFINDAYSNRKCADLNTQLQAISKQKRKGALNYVLNNMNDILNKMNEKLEFGDIGVNSASTIHSNKNTPTTLEKSNVDLNLINNDLNFLFIENSKFKGVKKQRFASIFIANSEQYLQILNEQFESNNNKNNNKSKANKYKRLTQFIDKKMGNNSTVGYWCKMHVRYSLNCVLFYAALIKDLGNKNWNKNKMQIVKICIQRMEIDLFQIQLKWIEKRYWDGKSLREYIIHKTGSQKKSYFLLKILENSQKYAS